MVLATRFASARSYVQIVDLAIPLRPYPQQGNLKSQHSRYMALYPCKGFSKATQEKYVMDADKMLNDLPTDRGTDMIPVSRR